MRRATRQLPAAALAAILAAAFLASCASLGDDLFLLAKLDDPAKANVLTEAGIEQYTVRLVQRAEYEAVKDVRRYFAAALRYDPSNARAKQYLDLVDTYLVTRLNASVKEADRLLARKTRTRDEEYLMVAAVEKAARLDAQNEDVRRLQKETAAVRDAMVKESLALEHATVEKITDRTADDARDQLWIDAYLAARRVLALDAKNETALAEQDRTCGQVEEAFARRLAAVRGLLGELKFTVSKAEIAEMSALSRRSGGLGDEAVRTATYELNHRWARWLYDQKEYASADVRVKAALAAQRTADAAALAKRIADALEKTETGVTFETALKDIDRLIGAGELVAAQNRLQTLEGSTTDKAKLQQLDARRERLRGFLADLYARGLAAYRVENFADAIEALETVVGIDVDYDQAADYLEKARSKQRLLEQY
jgi:nicotinamide mononucleotide adenylyltransferase